MIPATAIETIALLGQAFLGGATFDETRIGYGSQRTQSMREDVIFSLEIAFDKSIVRMNNPSLSVLSVLIDFPDSDLLNFRETRDLLLEFRKSPKWRRQTIIVAARSGDRCRILFEITRDSKNALKAELDQLLEFIGVPA